MQREVVCKCERHIAGRRPEWFDLATRTIGRLLPAALNGVRGDVHESGLLTWRAMAKHRTTTVDQCSASKRPIRHVGRRLLLPTLQMTCFELRDGCATDIVNDLRTLSKLCPYREAMFALTEWQFFESGWTRCLRSRAHRICLEVCKAIADGVYICCCGVRSNMFKLHNAPSIFPLLQLMVDELQQRA